MVVKLSASTIALVSRKARASQRPRKLKPPAEHPNLVNYLSFQVRRMA
jgi:hypothetical protein